MSHRSSKLIRFALLPIAAAAAVLTTGCANMVTTAAPVSTFSQTADIAGHVHGGNQAVSGADVRLYAAGTTGYGSAPTLYAVTTTASDGFGSFGFTKTAGAGRTTTKVYGCPTDGSDPQMYITAKGGSTQGAGNGTNAAAGFIIALGKCSTIGASTFVDLNEVTTVATLAALQQYFAPSNATTDGINHLGAPASTQAQTGFANGVATIPNMVSVTTGVAQATSVTGTPTGSTTPATVTITPEIAKINTVANILAACVNTTSSASTPCATLFTNAVPPSSSVTSQPALNLGTATDTLEAGYYMLTNPTSGSATALNNLFNLTAANAPFQPMLAAAPTDWTVGIRYSSTSACTVGTFLGTAYHVAPDAAGNIWIAGGSTNGNLMEISPNGTPLTCALGTSVTSSKSLALDVAGNVWIASGTAANLYKYVPATGTSTAWPTLAVPYVITGDATGNMYYTYVIGTGVAKFSGAAAATTPTASTQIATVQSAPFFISADTVGNIYTTNSAAGAATSIVYATYASTATGNTNGYLTTSTTTNVCNPYGVAVGIANAVNISNSNYAACGTGSANTFSTFTLGAAGNITSGPTTATYAGGMVGPRENAVDGAGNVWAPTSTAATTNYATSAASTSFAMSEFSAVGTALSPTGNTGSASVSGGFQKDTSIFPSSLRSVAIDPTGNVWVGLNTTATTATSISEIVGAAVPVVTPIASALLAGATTTNAVSKP